MAIAVPTAFTRLVRRQASLVVGLALVVCAGVAANIALQRWRTRLAPVALGPETLLAGTTVEGNLAHGEKRHYPLPLTAGRYVLLRVDQLGIDVVLRLLAADGTPFAESDGLTGDQGPDWISMISEKPGAYTLEIEGGGQSNGGRFALRVAEAGVADHRNRLRVAADTTAAAGRRWYFEGTRPSAERAEKEFEQALSTYAVAEDPGGEADSLLGLATARAALGRHSETVAPLSRALELARSLRDDRRAADVLWFRGLNYTRVAEWRKAVDDLTTALPLFRKLGNAARSARAAITLSDAHDQLGDRRQALRFATYGLLMARNSGDQYALCEALQARGSVALWIGRPRDALEPLAEALQISRQFGFMAIQSGILTSLGVAQRQLDRDVEARQTLGAALEIARQRGDHHHESEVLLQIAGTYKSPAEAAEKRHVLEQSLAASREVGNPRGEAANLTLLANLEEKAGNLVGARRLLEQAIAVREEQWRRAPNANLQAYYIADQYPTYEMYIDVLVRLHAAGRDPEAAALAFRVSEGIRARALRQQLVRAAKAVADPIPQKILDAPRKSGQDPESITISEVQRHLLDPDTILLEYSLGKDRSYLFAASPSSFRVFELPAKETIDAAARAVTSAATARNVPMKFETTDERQARVLRSDADFRETANALSQMLLAPVENEIPGKRLLLVSDGGLASVPFGALPVPGRVTMGLGGGTSVHEYVPLAIANELIELPSASVLRDIRRQRAGRRPSPKMLAVLADPVLGPEDPRLPAGSGRESAAPASVGRLAYDTTDWHRLPWARVEAEAILGMVPADQRFAALGFDANLETATDSSLAGYRIVHFATHALVDSRDSAASGIVLSAFDAGGRRRPDLLSLSEIYRLRLPAELVVLSACRTALGEEVRGEGLVGLARGFMYAGASRVVVSLWDVQDEATADLMKRFYSHLLQDGSTPAAALRLAQTEIWRSTKWSPPYYWAGFRLQGEWR